LVGGKKDNGRAGGTANHLAAHNRPARKRGPGNACRGNGGDGGKGGGDYEGKEMNIRGIWAGEFHGNKTRGNKNRPKGEVPTFCKGSAFPAYGEEEKGAYFA